jgi:membrane-associated HD superfamily phosphohydrolase
MRRLPIFALGMLTLFVLYTIQAFRLPVRKIVWDPGGSFLPSAVGLIMVGLVFLYFIKTLRRRAKQEVTVRKRLLLILVSVTALYALLLRYEFPLASFFYSFSVTKLVASEYKVRVSLPAALLLNAALVSSMCIVFWLLRVEFPTIFSL